MLQDVAGSKPANLLPGQKAARLRELLAGDSCVQVTSVSTLINASAVHMHAGQVSIEGMSAIGCV